MKAGDQEYLDAFFALSRTRAVGMAGVSAITFNEILSYLLLVGIDGRSARLKYVSLIERMDTAYMGYVSERAAKNKKKAP